MSGEQRRDRPADEVGEDAPDESSSADHHAARATPGPTTPDGAREQARAEERHGSEHLERRQQDDAVSPE